LKRPAAHVRSCGRLAIENSCGWKPIDCQHGREGLALALYSAAALLKNRRAAPACFRYRQLPLQFEEIWLA
jgi:hypothetical protein